MTTRPLALPALGDELRRDLAPVRALLRLAPHERVLHRLDELGLSYQRSGGPDRWRCQCPAHEDTRPSLSLGIGDDGRALLHCHAGCPREDVRAALGLPASALFARGATSAQLDARSAEREALALRRQAALMADAERLAELAEHEGWTADALERLCVGRYGRHSGRLAVPERDHRGRVVGFCLYRPRYARQSASDRLHKRVEQGGSRGFVYSAGGVAPGPLVVVEGPAKAIAAASLGWQVIGFASASRVGSERAWRTLGRDAEAIVVPDADAPGRRAAEQVAALLLPVATSVVVVDLFSRDDDGTDLADLLREQGPQEAQRRLGEAIGQSEPLAKPQRGRPAVERERAEQYLQEVLGDGQWHVSSYVKEHRPSLVKEHTLERARKRLGVEVRQGWSEGERRWLMRLPSEGEAG